MNKSISRTLTLAKRNIKEILRDPLSVILTIGMPLAMEILFYLLFHSMTAQFEMKYLAPGIVVFAQSFLTLFTGLLISMDRKTSFLTRLYVSKAKSYEFILGYAISVLPIALIQAVLFFLIGGIIDTSLFGFGMVLGILLSIITALLFIGLGILFGSICNEKSIGGVSSIAIAAQSMLSGMWFPVEGLNSGILTIMNILPFKNATVLIQNMILGVNDIFADFVKPLLIVLAYTLVTFVLAIVAFKQKMKEK